MLIHQKKKQKPRHEISISKAIDATSIPAFPLHLQGKKHKK
jgi:hypothetical protein